MGAICASVRGAMLVESEIDAINYQQNMEEELTKDEEMELSASEL